MRSAYHRLSIEEAQELTAEELLELRRYGVFPPIAGGDGEDDAGGGEDDAAAGGESDDSDDDDDVAASAGAGGGADDDDEEDHPDDVLELRRSEYERLRRIVREHDQLQKRSQREEAKRKEKLRKEQGQYEELLREKDESISAVEAERDEARYQLDNFRRRIRVTSAATRLGYKDPEDAFRFLSDEDTEDDVTTERALKRLAREKSYLVETRRSTGAPVNGDGVSLTMEQIKNMSESEINARWDEVQKAMAQG